MIAIRRISWAAVACMAAATTLSARAQTTTYEDVDGIRYQITRRNVQVPVTQVANQQQTVLRQQVTTQTLQQQQLYTVPVTQYQLVSTLRGRWNPFVTPYWTHEYQPVTTWQQQTATVQIPVNSVAWVPETRTVQAPTTTYRTVVAESRTPIGAAPAAGGSQQMMASTSGAATSPTSGPTATLAARPSATTGAASGVPAVASATTAYPAYGGQQMQSDPPKQATGWTAPSDTPRYGDSMRR
jgi:hypothetical protein